MRPEPIPQPDHGSAFLTGDSDRGPDYHVHRPTGGDGWLLFCTRSGGARFGAGGEHLAMRPRSLAIYAPHHAQDYRTDPALGRWSFVWAQFQADPDWLPLLNWERRLPGLGHLRIDDDEAWKAIDAAMAECHRFALGGQELRERFARNALERALLWATRCNPQEAQTGRLDSRVRRALDHLYGNLDRRLRLEDLAAAGGCSASRMAHLFREQVGQPPLRFLEQERLRRAGCLLADGEMPVQEVAAAVGYDDPFYFSTRFRKVMGRSPREWRRSH